NSMGFVQKQDLFFHLDHYFELTNNKDAVLSKDILKKSFLFHVKYLISLFILGLTIIGLRAIWILIFSKGLDRKSTRLNSSHVSISYAVFCLKKKTIHTHNIKQL